jgi:hypothetical protein
VRRPTARSSGLTVDGQVFFAWLAGNYLGQIDLATGSVRSWSRRFRVRALGFQSMR